MVALFAILLVLAGAYFAVRSIEWELVLQRIHRDGSPPAAAQLRLANYPVRLEFANLPVMREADTLHSASDCADCDTTTHSTEAQETIARAMPPVVETSAKPETAASSLREQFASAFRNFGMPIGQSHPPAGNQANFSPPNASPPVTSPSKKPVGGSRIIPVNFSLDRVRNTGEVIEVRKPVRTNGKLGGLVSLRIVGDTTVLVKSSDLASVLGEGQARARIGSLGAKADSSGFVDFDALRDAGIDVRYDAARDQVVVETKKS